MTEVIQYDEINASTPTDFQKLFDAVKYGPPFDLEKDFNEFGGFPDGFEVKSSPDFIYFRHDACAEVLRQAAGWVGPRSIVRILSQHIAACSKKPAE